MRLIVSSWDGVTIVDCKTGEKTTLVESTGSGHYYGISWNEKYMFLARRNTASHLHHGGDGGVDRYDMDLVRHDTILGGHVGICDVHQVAWNFSTARLYVTCSRLDGLTTCTEDGEDLEFCIPFFALEPFRLWDDHHINSVWFDGESMYVLAHKKGPSDLLELSCTWPYEVRSWYQGVAFTAHNVVRIEDCFLMLNSYNNNAVLVPVDGSEYSVPFQMDSGYPRGLAVSADRVFVGLSSQIASREERQQSKKGMVLMLDRTWRLLERIEINQGQVFEVRILDDVDYAHHSVPWQGKCGIHG